MGATPSRHVDGSVSPTEMEMEPSLTKTALSCDQLLPVGTGVDLLDCPRRAVRVLAVLSGLVNGRTGYTLPSWGCAGA